MSEAAGGGVRFLERKSWHFPWTDPNREIDRSEVARRLQQGDDRLSAQAPDAEVPTRLNSLEDLQELAVCHGPASTTGLPGALRQLAQLGWRFTSQEGEVGVYGAYEGISEGRFDVTARNGHAAVALGDAHKVERMARFYQKPNPIEQAGFHFFAPDGEPISAFEAGPACRIGQKDEAWIPATSSLAEVQEFARLRALARSPEEVARVQTLTGDEIRKFTEITRLRPDPQIVELALAATHPPENELRKELPALLETHGPEATAKVLAHLKDPIAAAIGQAKSRELIYAELKTPARTPQELGDLYKRVHARLDDEAAFAEVCLERALPGAGPGDIEAIAYLGNRSRSTDSKRRAVDTLAGLPECAGLKRLRDELLPACTDDLSQKVLYQGLLASPRVGTGDKEQQEVVNQVMIYLVNSDVKPKIRTAVEQRRLEALLAASPPDAEAIASQARRSSGDARRLAVERLKSLPECAGMKLALEGAEPYLTSERARNVLDQQLLDNALLSTDPARQQQFFHTLEAYLSNYDVPRPERAALAKGRLDALLKGKPDTDAVAQQAATVLSLGDVQTARDALGRLAPQCPGIQRALAEIEPDCVSEQGQKIFYQRLLGQPGVGADDASQQQLTQQVLSTWNSYDVPKSERARLAKSCLDRMMGKAISAERVPAIANQASYVLSMGDQKSARDAIVRMTALPECAGMKRALAELEPSCTSDVSRQQLYNRLLAQPTLGADEDSQQNLVDQLMSYLDSYDVPKRERAALASARLDRLLSGTPSVDALARQAQRCVSLGDLQAGQRALDRLKSECPGLAQGLSELGPSCTSQQSQKLLQQRLLANPRRGTDVVAQEQLMTELLSHMDSYECDKKERLGLARASLQRLLSQPLEPSLIQPIAARALSVASLGDRPQAEKALEHLFPLCPEGQRAYQDLEPICTSKDARRHLVDRLLADPTVPDRTRFVTQLGSYFENYEVSKSERQALFNAEMNRAIAGLPSEAAVVGKMAQLARSAGDKTATERALKAMNTVGPVAAIMQDWLPLARSEPVREALCDQLLSSPPGKDTPEERQALRERWLRQLRIHDIPAQALIRDLDRFESDRAARAEVNRLARPDKSTTIEDQDGQVVVGGVVLPKRG